MSSKRELYDQLQEQSADLHELQSENARFRANLIQIYLQAKGVLGIEAAIQDREDMRLKLEAELLAIAWDNLPGGIERVNQEITDPDWQKTRGQRGWNKDWEQCVPEPLQKLWSELPAVAKIVIYIMARERADAHNATDPPE